METYHSNMARRWVLSLHYLAFLEKLADKYFFDVYLDEAKLNERNQPKPNSFDDTLIRSGSLNVDLETVERNFCDVYPKGTANIPPLCI